MAKLKLDEMFSDRTTSGLQSHYINNRNTAWMMVLINQTRKTNANSFHEFVLRDTYMNHTSNSFPSAYKSRFSIKYKISRLNRKKQNIGLI